MKTHPYLIATLLAIPLHAGPRTSANYRQEPETIDGGGGRSSSANYTLDGSLATGGGRSNNPSEPPVLAKSGYCGPPLFSRSPSRSLALMRINLEKQFPSSHP